MIPISKHGHCQSDCCDLYPRLHLHGDPKQAERWIEALGHLDPDAGADGHEDRDGCLAVLAEVGRE